MSKNSTKNLEPNYFSGKCETCSEVYEAQSHTEDLEGITFKCKKVMCTGRVTLEVSFKKPGKSAAPMTPVNPGDIPSGTPRRYC